MFETESYEKYFAPRLPTRQNVLIYKTKAMFLQNQNSEGCVRSSDGVDQCFSTAGPRPGTGPWHQLYRAARGSPGICHFSFLSNFH